jgi:hypothetical protein
MTTASPERSRSAGAMSLLRTTTFPVHPPGNPPTTTTRQESSRTNDNYSCPASHRTTTTRTRKALKNNDNYTDGTAAMRSRESARLQRSTP